MAVVKVVDAPREGWYPDPQQASRLRWWDGTDWTDRYRPRPDAPTGQPMPGAGASNRAGAADTSAAAEMWSQASTAAGQIPQSTAAVVEQVRMAAREEAQLAAREFERRARQLTGEIPPLISEYTNKLMRFVRLFVVLGFLVFVGWLIYQFVVQKSIFDWIGDRIDNLTNNQGSLFTGW